MNDEQTVEEIEAELARSRAAYAAWVAEGSPHVTPESDEDGLQGRFEGARSVDDLLAELDADESGRRSSENSPQKLGETGAADTVQADGDPHRENPRRTTMNDTNGAPGAVSLDPPLLTWWPLLLTGLAALRAAEVGDGFDCPRCGGGIPSDAARGQYSGALSRADNATEICSRCGTDEAISHFYGWPWSRDLWLHPPGCAGECHGNQDIHTPEEDVARIQAALGAIIAPLIGARTAKERERTAKERERAGLLLDWYFELGDELHEGSER